jgi:endonuclease/exonuclease/phosphatase family metal-dependent hydrolase
VVPLRVVSYNVRSLRDDRDAVATTLRALSPDLVCVQEAPRFLFSRAKCAALAGAAGLSVLAGGRSAAGNLLLGGARVRLMSASRFRLPRSGRRHRRAVAVAEVEVDGARLVLAGTHLSLDPLERLQQVRRLVARLSDPPLILGADVNDVPGSPPWAVLTATLRDGYATAPHGDAFTFPARDPNRRLDAVFVSKEISVTGCGVPPDLVDPARATDHLPVVADLVI